MIGGLGRILKKVVKKTSDPARDPSASDLIHEKAENVQKGQEISHHSSVSTQAGSLKYWSYQRRS